MTLMHPRTRRPGPGALLPALFCIAALLLASCSSGSFNRGSQGEPEASPQLPSIGDGTVKVGLMLPLSATGNAGKTAQALKQAAELALFEFNNPDIVLIPKDTRGTAQGARAAAEALVAENVELILGPLFAQSVSAAAPVARGRDIPIIAFSTDSNVAGRGVYLLSFLPQSDVHEIVEYATSQGKRSLAALVPENAYGTLVEGALQQAAARYNARVAIIEKYPLDRQGMVEPAKRVAALAQGDSPQVDAILLPDGPTVLPSIGPLLTIEGVSPNRVKFLGTGQWNDPRTGREPTMSGGWFAAPEPAKWERFSQAYASTYGETPPRIASLSYDAVSLAAALAKQPPGQRFAQTVLTNPSGFNGIDGIFRFRANGLNDRGLAIHEVVNGGGSRVIKPAPTAFGPSSF